MALRARQVYIQQQPELPQHQQQEQRQPVVRKKPKLKLFSAQEKFLFVIFTVIVASFAVSILHTQGEIQTLSMEIQSIERDIAEINDNNTDLKVQVSERSTHQRIWEKAKELGLTLNEKNVKVVPGE